MDRSVGFRARRSRAGRKIAIAAVGFDFDHTLGIDNKLERVAFLRLLDAVRDSGEEHEAALVEEVAKIDGLLTRQRSGSCTIEDAVEEFMREHGVPDPGSYAERYKAMAVEMASTFVIPEPGVGRMLADLRSRGIPYAILTNGWSPLQQRKAARVHFDGPVLVSSDIGVQKPESRAFAALCEALGEPADRVAYVGDAPASDVAGALNAGMQAVWYDAEGVTYPKDIPAPSAVIHSLTELLGLM